MPRSPKTPYGLTNREFGEIMAWGTGSADARSRIATLSVNDLWPAGVTIEIACEWRDFYLDEFENNPNNPSAEGRAELMHYAMMLLDNDICNKVMRWGTDPMTARNRVATLTLKELNAGGITIEMARAWRDYYEREVRYNAKNVIAQGRLELLCYAVAIMGARS